MLETEELAARRREWNAIAWETRQIVGARDGWACRYCGCPVTAPGQVGCHPNGDEPLPGFRWATVDHVVPLSLGGTNALHNLALACAPCNARKGNR